MPPEGIDGHSEPIFIIRREDKYGLASVGAIFFIRKEVVKGCRGFVRRHVGAC